MPKLKARFRRYVALALNNQEGAYDGPSLYQAHAGRGITGEAVETFIELLVETLGELELPAATMSAFKTKLEAMKNLIVR